MTKGVAAGSVYRGDAQDMGWEWERDADSGKRCSEHQLVKKKGPGS